jgi:hypothetical protein
MTERIDADELGAFRSALQLADNMMRWSRTSQAGRLRFLCAMHIVLGEPDVDVIAKRLKVTPRRVRQAIREVRCHCEPLSISSRDKSKMPDFHPDFP